MVQDLAFVNTVLSQPLNLVLLLPIGMHTSMVGSFSIINGRFPADLGRVWLRFVGMYHKYAVQ